MESNAVEARTFSGIDYTVFGLSLLLSATIGIYYGCFGGKQNTTTDFLMGGKDMGILPVALSMVASFLSAISVLGQPAEIYYFGTQFCFFILSAFICMPLVSIIFLPVFHGLQVTSAYEVRFSLLGIFCKSAINIFFVDAVIIFLKQVSFCNFY